MKLKIIKKDDSEDIIEIRQYFYELENQRMCYLLLNYEVMKTIDLKEVKVIAVY